MLPVELVEQAVLGRLVVARLGRVHVPRVEPRCHPSVATTGPVRATEAELRGREQARARDAGAVDQQTDEVGARHLDAEVGGARRRGRRRVDPHAAQLSGKRVEHRGVDRLGRAVVDHDHLVVVGLDPALVPGRERSQRARQLTRHVVRDDHDDDAQRPGSGRHAQNVTGICASG